MSTLEQMTDEVLLYLQGYGLDQNRATFLAADVDADDLVFSVDDPGPLQEGLAEVGDELVYVRSYNDSASTATISPDGRGYRGSTAAAHTAGTRLTIGPTFPRHVVANAINDVIEAVYPTLWGVGSTLISFQPTQNTYSLPLEAERVLSVSTDIYGPSEEWLRVRDWRFDSAADTGSFATGNTITLGRGLYPGKDFKVTFSKAPTRLASGDDLTVSGLQSTAKLAIVYGAASQVIQFIDPARLQVNAVEADELDEPKPIGRASQIAQSLQGRHLQEVLAEQRRLRQAYPPVIHQTRSR